MKRPSNNTKRVIALILAAALLVSTIVMAVLSAMAVAEEVGQDTGYEVTVTIDEKLLGAEVSERLFYRNDTGKDLTALFFALPVNTFRRQETFPFENSDAISIGGASIKSVALNGQETKWGVSGTDEATLRVECALAQDETCEIAIESEVLLPAAPSLIGCDELSLRLYGTFPVLAQYDRNVEDFVVNAYTAMNDGVFAPCAAWDITVHAPASYLLCCGGNAAMTKAADGHSVWNVRYEDGRCPVIVLSAKYRLYDGKQTKVYANSRTFAREALTASEEVAKTYAQWFGKCAFSVCESTQNASADNVLLLNNEDIEFNTAYQAARQVFGERIAVNRANEAWLVDAAAEYTALLYMEEKYGYDRFLKELNKRVTPALQVTVPGALYPDSETSLMGTVDNYNTVVVQRGAACLHELRGLIGRENFLNGLSAYVSRNSGKSASIGEFVSAMNAASGRDIDYFLMEMFRDIDSYVEQGIEWYE